MRTLAIRHRPLFRGIAITNYQPNLLPQTLYSRVLEIVCIDCATALTPEERHYYIDRCESCERTYMDRIGAWLDGERDDEFDALYGGVGY
jgi:hypothetical protein